MLPGKDDLVWWARKRRRKRMSFVCDFSLSQRWKDWITFFLFPFCCCWSVVVVGADFTDETFMNDKLMSSNEFVEWLLLFVPDACWRENERDFSPLEWMIYSLTVDVCRWIPGGVAVLTLIRSEFGRAGLPVLDIRRRASPADGKRVDELPERSEPLLITRGNIGTFVRRVDGCALERFSSKWWNTRECIPLTWPF